MADVVGIVLGAACRRRLGRPKQTLPLGDTTLLAGCARRRGVVPRPGDPAARGGGRGGARRGGPRPDRGGDQRRLRRRVRLLPGRRSRRRGRRARDGPPPRRHARRRRAALDAVRADGTATGPGRRHRLSRHAGPPLGLLGGRLRRAARAPRGQGGLEAAGRQPGTVPPGPVDRPLPQDVDTRDDYVAARRALGVA